MPDNVKDLIRAAQAAEIRGDYALAIDFLKKSAAAYESLGNVPRAQQMLRHVQRLNGKPSTIDAVVERPAPVVINGLSRFQQRGPTLADESLDAWCSFCCRPQKDLGSMVAGPAGAFICGSCALEAQRLVSKVEIQGDPVPRDPVIRLSAVEAEGGPLPTDFVGREHAFALFEVAQQSDGGLVLVVGPSGSGKTAFLRALQARGHGRYVRGSEGPRDSVATEPLLFDFQEPASPAWENPPPRWDHPERGLVVATARGKLSRAALTIDHVPVHSTRELGQSVGEWLPSWMLERVTLVISLEPLTAKELKRVAASLAAELKVNASPSALAKISALAAKSNRATHELVSLLRRIPSGARKAKRPGPRIVKTKKR